jgi:septum formation topological specificity factor MinE
MNQFEQNQICFVTNILPNAENLIMLLKDQLSQKIFEFEKKFPVHQLWIDSRYPMWSIIRVLSHYWVVQIDKVEMDQNQRNQQVTETFHLQKDLLSLIEDNVEQSSFSDHVLSHPADGDVFFITNVNNRRFSTQNGLYDIYIDPLIALLKKNGISFSLLEYGNDQIYNLPRAYPSFYLEDIVHQARLKVASQLARMNPVALQEPPFFKTFLEFTGFNKQAKLFPPWLSFLKSFGLFQVLVDYFYNLFQQKRPKRVVVVCWWGVQVMAAIQAAHQLGIPTMDLQHGGLGTYHIPNRFWYKKPEKGYSNVPDFFWTWGRYFKEMIVENNVVFQDENIIEGGFPWLLQWRDKHNPDLLLSRTIYKRKLRPKEDQSNILCTQAGFFEEKEFADFILSISQAIDRPCHWFIRIHQGQLYKINTLKECFQGFEEYIHIEEACKYPLYTLFDNADVHLSWGSTTTYESLAVNVPTIVVNEIGRSRNADIINYDFLPYSTEPIDIANQIMLYLDRPDIFESQKEDIHRVISSYFSLSEANVERQLLFFLGET